MELELSPRILLLGHSFIWRIARFVIVTSLPCVANTFHLSRQPVVKFHGIGGGTLPKVRKFDLLAVAHFEPTIVILEISSNDLCDPNINISSLANDMFHFFQQLRLQLSVAHIIVNQILPRVRCPSVTPPYNVRISHLPFTLPSPFAAFWFHHSVINTRQFVFLPDGVHLNSHGNHFLYHSYQKALLRYLSRVARNRSNRSVSVFHRPPCRPRHQPSARYNRL